jgi:hypothetical protein
MNVSAYGIPGILLKQYLKSNGLKKTNRTKTIPVENRIMIFVNLIQNCAKIRDDRGFFLLKVLWSGSATGLVGLHKFTLFRNGFSVPNLQGL